MLASIRLIIARSFALFPELSFPGSTVCVSSAVSQPASVFHAATSDASLNRAR
jgi:hypothetical protein